MGTDCDMKKRVSNLESIGRKICSDLRNFQKERVILSQEAKCLIREIEKGQARGRHNNKNKHAKNTSCTCAIWEKDLIKDAESDLEESSKFQKDEQLLKCDNCCKCCDALDEDNYDEDLFEIDDCSICRFNESDEPYHHTQSVTVINDADDDDDSCCFDKNNIVEDNINDIHCMIRSCEPYRIDSTDFCNICVYCKGNNAKNMHVLSSNHKLNINNESDMQDSIERQRGGGGSSDSESTNDETTNTSICTCNCDICALRNTHGTKPPCCLRDNEQIDHSIDVDYDENLQLNHSVVSDLSEMHQYCKITKLREALEKLKNRNHTLRKLLKKRDCLITSSMMEQANSKFCPSLDNDENNDGRDSKSLRDKCKETPRELTAILKILQSKCRTKDGMIVALADELKECATNERIKRILDKLTDANVHCDIIDFDRSTLWKYLISEQFNVMEQHSDGRKSIVCQKAQCNEIMIGQWPYQTIRRKYVSLVVLFALAGTQIVAKLCATIPSFYDINLVMNDMTPLIGDVIGVIKLVNSTVKTKKMRKLLNRMKMDYASFETDEEIKIMHEYANGGRKFTIMYSGLFGVTLLCFMIPPLKAIFFSNTNGTNEREFIHHVEYFVDPLHYYYPIILHSYITVFIVIFTIVTMDTAFLIFVQHACGLFTALGYRLCHIVDKDAMTIDIKPSKENDEPFKNITQCVRKHQEAIKFAKLMESYYSTSFFMQAGVNMIGMSITGLQAMTTNETNNFFQHFSVFYSTLAHIFFECANGQRLIDHSGRIYHYLVNMEWYKMSFRTRKVILFMLVRSRVSCKLTAANVLNISMETFSAIIRTSISYFTMLRSMQ